MSHKVFDNNLAPINKSKLALKLNKPAYIGMYMLELRKVLIYEFHYDYINKCTSIINSRVMLSMLELHYLNFSY